MIRVCDPAITPAIVSFHRGLLANHMPPDGHVEPGKLLAVTWDGPEAWRVEPKLTFITHDGVWTVTADAVERWYPLAHEGTEVARWSNGHEVERYVIAG